MTEVYSHSHNYYNYHYCVGNYGENNITILHYTVNEIYIHDYSKIFWFMSLVYTVVWSDHHDQIEQIFLLYYSVLLYTFYPLHVSQGIQYLGITGYGSTLYIGMTWYFVFSPYIRKFSSYFHFQVILTFMALHM